jgi:beta-lactamase class A
MNLPLPMPLTRRAFLATSLVAAPVLAIARTPTPWHDDPGQRLARLEERHGGRLGVAVVDTGSGAQLTFRAYDRYALCSTFKWLLAAQVLAAVDAGREQLDRRLHWRTEQLVAWSPVVENADPAAGLTIAQLCAAAVSVSDNTAANLLLAAHGGPAGLTAWLRASGDPTTRLDRDEPSLNEAAIGDPRDTTTPAAMTATLQRVLLGDVLTPTSRAQLTDWMLATSTGDRRLRAGLPGWRIGDKTGTSGGSVSNDVAIAWPPGGGAPLLIAAYYAESTATPAQREAVLAEVGAIAAAWAMA